jgi:hypothetical protein
MRICIIRLMSVRVTIVKQGGELVFGNEAML